MSEKDTGGPAFPSKRRVYRAGYATQDFEPVGGMTLRDYFAGKAMQALIHKNYFDVAAKEAYDMADAMLKAREGK